jgi:CheY-like chemotaxis protein
MSSVLIVDDDVDFRFLLTAHFKSRGWSVSVAASGEEALGTLSNKTSLPSLIISDHQMGSMSGLELSKQLRLNKATVNIPFILSSGLPQQSVENILQKPYSIQALDSLVDKLVH